MLKSTRERILSQHIDQVLLLTGLKKVPVTDISGCEVSDGYAWVPVEFDLDGYMEILHQIGLWMFRDEQPICREIKAWRWALDTSRFQYKRFYKTAVADFDRVREFLTDMEAKIG